VQGPPPGPGINPCGWANTVIEYDILLENAPRGTQGNGVVATDPNQLPCAIHAPCGFDAGLCTWGGQTYIFECSDPQGGWTVTADKTPANWVQVAQGEPCQVQEN
jgi:hypothetical protein